MTENTEQSSPNLILNLARYLLNRYRWETVLVFLGMAVSSLSEGIGIMTLILALQVINNGDVSSETESIVMLENILNKLHIGTELGPVLTVVVVTIVTKALMNMAAMSYAEYIASKIEADFRLDLTRAILRARWDYFVSKPVGHFTNAMNVEASSGARLYSTMCRSVAVTLSMCVYFSAALLLSWQLAIATVVSSLVMVLALGRLIKVSRRTGHKSAVLYKSLAARVVDGIQGIKSLKSMGKEKFLIPILKKEIRSLRNVQFLQRIAKIVLVDVREPFIVLVASIGIYVAITILGLEISIMIGMAILFHRALNGVGQLQRSYQALVSLEGFYTSFSDTLTTAMNHQEEIDRGQQVASLERGITFSNVTFGYEQSREILTNVTMEIPVNSVTALIGPSGSGKTTIADLLCRLIDPDEGSIWVDHIKLHAANLADWRSKIGYVQQDGLLFNDSIKTNISLGDKNISDEQVICALSDAGLSELVLNYPEGINTQVGERGVMLSGGQRQRILIARALAGYPKLLILDEATSALDPETEKELINTIDVLKQQVTIFAISHQPAIIRIADRVYELELGNVQLSSQNN